MVDMTTTMQYIIPSEEQLQSLLGENEFINTKRTIKAAVKCFKDFLIECGKLEDFEACDKEDFNYPLQLFHAGARKGSGDKFNSRGIRYNKSFCP